MSANRLTASVTSEVLEELLARDRKALLGELIQGVLHNINGPLQNIFMASELLKDQLLHHKEFLYSSGLADNKVIEDVEKQLARIGHIQEGAYNLSNLTQNLIHGMQDQGGEIKTDLNLAIKKLVEFYQNNLFFKHRVEVVLELEESLPRISVPISDFWQSAAHIIKNAIEAMENVEGKRVLTIRTRIEDGAVIVAFRDTGVGIPEEVRDKIFNLYYTTKKAPDNNNGDLSEPLGLGLYCAKHLMSRHGVEIEVDSKNGYTEFSMIIPLDGFKN